MSVETPSIRIKYALQGTSVSLMEDADLFESVKGFYGKAYLYLSYKKPDAATMHIEINELTDKIRNYPQLRGQELQIIAELGCIKKFGDFMGLSIATFLQWIEAYLKCEERKSQVMIYEPERQLPENTESGLEEKNKIAEMSIASAVWTRFEKTGVFEDYNNICYNYLDKTGQIPEGFKAELYLGEAAVITRRENTVKTFDITLRVAQSKILASLEAGTYADKLLILAKKLALKEYFEQLIEDNG